MDQAKLRQAEEALRSIAPFLSMLQLAVIAAGLLGEEADHFAQVVKRLVGRITFMPVTHEQDGLGDRMMAYLHYFSGAADWYITERDTDDDSQQAFGYAVLSGDAENAELGYISISELVEHGVELDLHFEPVTLEAVKARHRR